MKQIFHETFGQLVGRMLGIDGCVTLAFLGFAMWCGHYAVRGFRTRPVELVILAPLTLASFVGAAFICESTVKFLMLSILALLAYLGAVKTSDASRSGG